MNIDITPKEQQFIDAYLECIAFTEEAEGKELDETFMRESVIDCLSFYQRICCYLSDDQIDQAGHDFWLTRNGHGAGFWDGDWPKHGDMFTKISECYGSVDPYFEDARHCGGLAK